MRLEWCGVLFAVLLLSLCDSSAAQIDEDGENVNDDYNWENYDDNGDRFDDLFKRFDDYNYGWNKKEQEQPNDTPYEADQVVKKHISDEIIPKENSEDAEIQIEDTNDASFKDSLTDFDDLINKDSDSGVDEDVQTLIQQVEDWNMNGNAPPNDYDPLENLIENDNSESLQNYENSIEKDENQVRDKELESPYASFAEFDETSKNQVDNVQKEESIEIANIKNSDAVYGSEVQLEKIIEETQDLLDSKSNDFADDLVSNNDYVPAEIIEETQHLLEENSDDDFEINSLQVNDEVPDKIVEDSQKLIDNDSNNDSLNDLDEHDSVDNIYNDINADLVNLYETLDKLMEDNNVNKEPEQSDNFWENINDESAKMSLDENEDDPTKEKEKPDPVQQEIGDSSKNILFEQMNNLIEKELQESQDNFNEDTEEDYKDFYDDDDDDNNNNNDIETNNEEQGIDIPVISKPITYGNDALYANEADIQNDDDQANSNDAIIAGDESSEDEMQSIPDLTANNDILESQLEDDININEDTKPLSDDIEIEPTSQELNDKIQQFRLDHQDEIENDAVKSDVPIIHMTLGVDKPIVVTSPDYPSPYPVNNIIDWVFDGEEGTGIEFNITDLFINGAAGDYLLIKPGGVDVSGTDGILFSYHLRHERKYRFFDVDKLFVRFESKSANNNFFRGFQFSVKFISKKIDRIAVPAPEPEPVAQEPTETLNVYLTGLAPHEFKNVSEQFRSILVDMCTMYINREGIDAGVLPISEVVQLTRVSVCNINWPYHDSCTAVTFGVPLYYDVTDEDFNDDGDDDAPLSEDQLMDMWSSYSGVDPFAVRLRLLGIMEYTVPNDRSVMSLWWLASFSMVLLVLVIGLTMHRWNYFQDYTGMQRLSETDSIASDRKSDLSLYPTPHQDLPPMFTDQYDNYMESDVPPKYNDTTRVDMGGAFDNKSFVRDGELFDLDSDEEIIMSLPDENKNSPKISSDMRPRDLFDV